MDSVGGCCAGRWLLLVGEVSEADRSCVESPQYFRAAARHDEERNH